MPEGHLGKKMALGPLWLWGGVVIVVVVLVVGPGPIRMVVLFSLHLGVSASFT